MFRSAVGSLPSTAVPTALLSVYDKTGIVELGRGLHELGWRLVSSGGTARALSAAGLRVTDVAELTGLPAILGHRVVTLHPKVHGGILADLDDPEHRRELEEHGIEPISLVVVNLYPFADDPGIELIDIGGPAMVRAAAKNHAHVGVVVDPAEYEPVLDELHADGGISADTHRRRLARQAFARTSAYDAEIVAWLDGKSTDSEGPLPDSLTLRLDRVQELRYGENPHQLAARYRERGRTGWWDSAQQHGGKALSYLNLYDAEAAWRLVHRFAEPACVIVKHANPCGVAVAGDITTAYERAHACDPVSAFGGIVAVNRALPPSAAAALAPVFTEVVVAPGYEGEALDTLVAKANLRVLTAAAPGAPTLDLRPVDGGLLVQTPDPVAIDRDAWWVVSAAQPTPAQWDDLRRSPGRCALPSARTPSSSPETSRRSVSAPASRTVSTRHASPQTGRATGLLAGCPRATPSSPSTTASTRRRLPASRR